MKKVHVSGDVGGAGAGAGAGNGVGGEKVVAVTGTGGSTGGVASPGGVSDGGGTGRIAGAAGAGDGDDAERGTGGAFTGNDAGSVLGKANSLPGGFAGNSTSTHLKSLFKTNACLYERLFRCMSEQIDCGRSFACVFDSEGKVKGSLMVELDKLHPDEMVVFKTQFPENYNLAYASAAFAIYGYEWTIATIQSLIRGSPRSCDYPSGLVGNMPDHRPRSTAPAK